MPYETDVGSKFWIHKQWSEAKTGWQWLRDLSTTMPFYLTNDWIHVSDEESIYKVDLTFLHNPLIKTVNYQFNATSGTQGKDSYSLFYNTTTF